MAVAVLLPELAWNLDFFTRLIAGRDLTGLDATAYMFNPAQPLWLRGLSLFHVFLPALLVWMLYRLGYDRRAWLAATLLCWVVLPATYLFTDPARNINWVFGLGDTPQTWLPAPLYLMGLMLLFPLCVYLPAHLVGCKKHLQGAEFPATLWKRKKPIPICAIRLRLDGILGKPLSCAETWGVKFKRDGQNALESAGNPGAGLWRLIRPALFFPVVETMKDRNPLS